MKMCARKYMFGDKSTLQVYTTFAPMDYESIVSILYMYCIYIICIV